MPTHEEHASQTAPEWPKICPKCEKSTHSRYGATYLGDDRMLCGQCFFGLQREREEQRKEDEKQAKLDAENAIRQEERTHILTMIDEAVQKIDNDPSDIRSDLEFLSGMRVGLRSLAEKIKSSNEEGV